MHKRIGALEKWIFEQAGSSSTTITATPTAGWRSPYRQRQAVMTNPPFGVGATKLEALDALYVVAGGEPVAAMVKSLLHVAGPPARLR